MTTMPIVAFVAVAGLVGAQGSPDAVRSEETFRFLGAPELWLVALLIVPAVVAFAWWTYSGLTRMERRPRILLASLRALAVAILLVALFQPAIEQVRYTSIRTQVQVLLDDSASMQRRDTYPDSDQQTRLQAAAGVSQLDALSRVELLAKVLGKPQGLIERLAENHDVRLFRFSREPRLVRGLDELTARGARSHLGDALDLLRGQSSGAGVDAVILVSDGCNNGGLPPVEVAEKYRADDVPIYALGVGDPNPPHNVRLVGPPGPPEALKREEVAFDVTVSAEGLAGRSVVVTLEGARDGGSYLPLASQPVILADDGVPVKVRIYHAFDQAGDWTIKFEIQPFPEETSREDNVATRLLRVIDQKIRVLYVEDLPRWEYRYIKNALLRVDPSIEVQVYLFDASRDFRQEASKQLEPLRELPRTRDELLNYHVVLLGDIAPERLGATEEQRNRWLQLLVEFVELGGGAGFLFGEQAMPERYRATPLEDLLPVVLEDPLELNALQLDRRAGFIPQLENPVRPHDVALVQRDPSANTKLFHEGFAPLMVYYPVQKAKAGAEIILLHPTDANRYGRRPLVVASEYPRGRTLFVGTDETWRWRKPYGEKHHDAFWRNVARWLAGGRLKRRDDRYDLRLDKVIVETGEQVRINLNVRDAELQPSRAPEHVVYFRRPEGQPEKRALRALPGEIGAFEGSFTMEQPGSVSVLVHEGDTPAGRVLAREDVLVKMPDRELQQSSQDQAMLEKIAAASKDGRYLFLADADQLVAEFQDRKPYQHRVDSSTRPLWDQAWVLAVVLGLLAAEWLLRKRQRLV